MRFLRLLSWPFSLLYRIVTFLRNLLYDRGLLRSTSFSDCALIGVGNLTVGGTGKTPHVEYLVKLLHTSHTVATLSRGYGRRSNGFLIADRSSTADDIGDEPKQFRRRFPDSVVVAVDARRVHGVNQLCETYPGLQCVILDDVFQHRSIRPGLQILLTDYNRPYYLDNLLPMGLLREPPSGMKRADIIIVTKTPVLFSPLERRRILREINPLAHQQVYFSTIRYGEFLPLSEKPEKPLLGKGYYFERNFTIILLTGIANAKVLEYELKDKVSTIIPLRFTDHHAYSAADMVRLREVYSAASGENKLILTTEKDAMRLLKAELQNELEGLPIFYIPIEIAFHDHDGELFNKQVLDHVKSRVKINP
jgi:tetraacyldisaccharide 4'-kinase